MKSTSTTKSKKQTQGNTEISLWFSERVSPRLPFQIRLDVPPGYHTGLIQIQADG